MLKQNKDNYQHNINQTLKIYIYIGINLGGKTEKFNIKK